MYPWIRKIPWRRKWQPTPVFLPEKFHGQRSLAGSIPWGRSQSQTWLSNWAHTQTTLTPNSQHSYMTTEKTTAWLYGQLLLKWWLCVLKYCLGLSQLSFQGQVSFNFMTAVSICSDFGDQEKKISLLLLFPYLELKGRDAMILVFWMLSFKPDFSTSSKGL